MWPLAAVSFLPDSPDATESALGLPGGALEAARRDWAASVQQACEPLGLQVHEGAVDPAQDQLDVMLGEMRYVYATGPGELVIMAVRSDREAGAEVARALQAVEDPELPVSIVDLGMVRAVTVSAGAAVVELVPTFLACPALWLVESEVRERATGVPGVTQCQVIWRPGGWSGADVTEAGRAALAGVGLVVPGDDGTVRCPFCGSAEVTATSAFGSAVCRSAAFCTACRTPVEVLKTKARPDRTGPATEPPGPAQPVELRLVPPGRVSGHWQRAGRRRAGRLRGRRRSGDPARWRADALDEQVVERGRQPRWR